MVWEEIGQREEGGGGGGGIAKSYQGAVIPILLEFLGTRLVPDMLPDTPGWGWISPNGLECLPGASIPNTGPVLLHFPHLVKYWSLFGTSMGPFMPIQDYPWIALFLENPDCVMGP